MSEALTVTPSTDESALAGVSDFSPNRRYLRWSEQISDSNSNNQGQVKLSYKAFDTKNGIEVVWHTIQLDLLDESQQIRVTQTVNIAKNIQNKNIIEYQSVWLNHDTRIFNIITTRLVTLKEFVGKVVTLRWKIVKKWSKQILRGLNFLHSSTPTLVHCNLTCSHIYIDAGTSNTSIGDMWMSSILAPEAAGGEASEENYPVRFQHKNMPASYIPSETELTVKFDIYSFGMSILEMITHEQPYSECKSPAEITALASAGTPPRVLDRVEHPMAKLFILACIAPLSERPTAAELIDHPFLTSGPDDDEELIVNPQQASEKPQSEASDLSLVESKDAVTVEVTNVHASSTIELPSVNQAAAGSESATPASARLSVIVTQPLDPSSARSRPPSVKHEGKIDPNAAFASDARGDKLGKELAAFEHEESVVMVGIILLQSLFLSHHFSNEYGSLICRTKVSTTGELQTMTMARRPPLSRPRLPLNPRPRSRLLAPPLEWCS